MKKKLFYSFLLLFVPFVTYGATYEQHAEMLNAYDTGHTGCTSGSAVGNIGMDSNQYQFVSWESIPLDIELDSVDVYMGVLGSPTDDVVMRIAYYSAEDDSFGYGNVFATSSAVDVGTDGIYTFNFNEDLTAGTYAFSIVRNGSTDTSNYYRIHGFSGCYIRSDQSLSTKIFTDSNSNWTNITTNILFTLNGTVETSSGSSEPATTTVSVVFDDFFSEEEREMLEILVLVACIVLATSLVIFFRRIVTSFD
jgi:hypothetical protein